MPCCDLDSHIRPYGKVTSSSFSHSELRPLFRGGDEGGDRGPGGRGRGRPRRSGCAEPGSLAPAPGRRRRRAPELSLSQLLSLWILQASLERAAAHGVELGGRFDRAVQVARSSASFGKSVPGSPAGHPHWGWRKVLTGTARIPPPHPGQSVYEGPWQSRTGTGDC